MLEVVRKLNTFIGGPLKEEIQKLMENSEIFDISQRLTKYEDLSSRKTLKKIIDNILLGGDSSKQDPKKTDRPQNLKFMIVDMINLMCDYQITTNKVFLRLLDSDK